MVVSRKLLPSFDLVPVVVPMDLPASGFGSVVAAVAGGPHSSLAAEVAAVIGRNASVRASMVCAYREDGEANARAWVDRLVLTAPDLHGARSRWVGRRPDRPDPGRRPACTWCPGGTWFQRLFFGAGARLAKRRQTAQSWSAARRSGYSM